MGQLMARKQSNKLQELLRRTPESGQFMTMCKTHRLYVKNGFSHSDVTH